MDLSATDADDAAAAGNTGLRAESATGSWSWSTESRQQLLGDPDQPRVRKDLGEARVTTPQIWRLSAEDRS
ncbi:hypothetical protein [Candidatus Mycobacterium methanotrophicum]|uniref:Uncharacterized protein n=1 Tax=Candidatus Mycobacterium methanotrophicum TaxID=2943498 RepID=A0ABY4QN37_9MYCO|nr:hypothetical protein [Candidatus Mycobacterium methanotrophicum]UQX11662.1 hypothetical protein M5I08_04130 [Candidatus Mycobacterium methanotrophicum]